MGAWAKVALTVLVVLVPGGFLLALAFAFFRVLRTGWKAAQSGAPGQAVSLRAVVARVDLRDVMRLARRR